MEVYKHTHAGIFHVNFKCIHDLKITSRKIDIELNWMFYPISKYAVGVHKIIIYFFSISIVFCFRFHFTYVFCQNGFKNKINFEKDVEILTEKYFYCSHFLCPYIPDLTLKAIKVSFTLVLK